MHLNEIVEFVATFSEQLHSAPLTDEQAYDFKQRFIGIDEIGNNYVREAKKINSNGSALLTTYKIENINLDINSK